MTVTSHEASAGIREIEVWDSEGPLNFLGETVADLSWDYDTAFNQGFHRWTDMTLYRVHEDGSDYRYAVQVVGRTVLYHRPGGSCHYGVSVPVGHLRKNEERYEALVACNRRGCVPEDLDDLPSTATVAVEEDIFTLYRCENASAVVHTMQSRDAGGLNLKLLQSAASVDPDIKAAMVKTRRL